MINIFKNYQNKYSYEIYFIDISGKILDYSQDIKHF
jgi:hypothetical protein